MIGNTLVIGFGHKAQNGKDTAARYIHEAHPRDTKIYSFAGDLKAYCRVAYRMTKKNAPLLQRVGLAFRHDNPDFGIDCLRNQIADDAPKVALIPDVRFPNEARFCDAAIKVTRLVRDLQAPGYVPYVAQDRPADHPSEIALDDYDGWFEEIEVIDGDLEPLKNAALFAYHDVLEHAKALAFIPTEAA